MAENEQNLEDVSEKLDGALDELKKFYKASTDVKLKYLIVDNVLPVLQMMRTEYMEGLAYLEDELEAGASEEFTDQTRRTVAALGKVLDATWAAVGWMDEKGFTDKAPTEMKESFQAAATLVSELLERAEEEDEPEDEDEEDEGQGATA